MSITETLSRTTTPAQVAGRFGAYGGRYVPETLVAALDELDHAYAEAIRVAQPYAVDVASGVEARPGRKAPGKLRALFDAIASA